MKNFENPAFLKKKYDLHNTPEVELAAKRTEKRTGEKVMHNPEARVQNYLDRFKEIVERKEPAKRERGIEALKKVLHDKFIIKEDEIPESYFETQKRLAREQGHGDIEITEELKKQSTEVIITDQKGSLDQWVDYLSSDDATYPDWLKYYAFRSILGMGEYNKEKKQFTKRTKGTVKPFPDINREALAYVLDAIEKKYQNKIPVEIDPEFKKYLAGENFAKLYAFAIDKITPTTESVLANVKGEWVKYRQGKDHRPLVKSLQGYGTGWCTAGESTAQAQLQNGDFYVYYSLDENGKPNIPRVAIRMQNENIAEVRGIAPDQNLDPYISEIVQEKLREFPDSVAYKKKNNDMKFLTLIDQKTKAGEQLTKDDLVFLYEIDSAIDGFGYEQDPRIKELKGQRDKNSDMLVIFDCQPDQIIHSQTELEKAIQAEIEVKAYLGELFPDIFKLLPSGLEYIYTEFPESKIRQKMITLGTGLKTPDDFVRELKKRGNEVSDWSKDIMSKAEFIVSEKETQEKLIILAVADLGFKNGATVKDIYDRAKELGLELCPPETGPQLRLQYQDQPKDEYCVIGMNPISGADGYPFLFDVDYDDGKLWLFTNFGGSDSRYHSLIRFAFALASNS